MTDNLKLLALIRCPRCDHRKIVPLPKARTGTTLKCPRTDCRHEFVYRLRLHFDAPRYPDISPEAFTHDLDRRAVAALRRVPGIDLAVRRMMEFGYEKIFRVRAMADGVQVTGKTLGHIHDMASAAAESLGVPVPDIFIFQDRRPNAFTVGTEYPLIVLHSGLLDLLDPDELLAAIAHEVGHIKCHHGLYLTLSNFLKNCLWFLGALRAFALPLDLALAEWYRKAELSADRASLLVSDDRSAVIRALMKCAGGSPTVSEMMDEEDFLEQAGRFEALTEEVGLNRFYRFSAYLWRSHPFGVLRASEIDRWSRSGGYRKIRSGTYPKRILDDQAADSAPKQCPECKTTVGAGAAFCDRCGHPVRKLANQYGPDGFNAFLKTMKDGYLRMKTRVQAPVEEGDGEEPPGPEPVPRMCATCLEMVYDPRVAQCPQDGGELV